MKQSGSKTTGVPHQGRATAPVDDLGCRGAPTAETEAYRAKPKPLSPLFVRDLLAGSCKSSWPPQRGRRDPAAAGGNASRRYVLVRRAAVPPKGLAEPGHFTQMHQLYMVDRTATYAGWHLKGGASHRPYRSALTKTHKSHLQTRWGSSHRPYRSVGAWSCKTALPPTRKLIPRLTHLH